MMISICCITYGQEAYIKQTIDGFLAQKISCDFEIIIAEDCSPDNTREILLSYKKNYPGLIKLLLNDTNVGMMQNFLNALQACKGKYIAFCEGDDYWIDEYKLEKQINLLESDPTAAMCFTNSKVWSEYDKQFSPHWSGKYMTKNRFTLMDLLNTNVVATCTVLFKNIIKELPSDFTGFPTGDLPLFSFLLLKGDALYLNSITSVYRLHDKGVHSALSFEKQNLIFLTIYESLLKYTVFEAHTNEIKKLISDRIYQALCFEIKKELPSQTKIEDFLRKSRQYITYTNLKFTLKTFLREKLFRLTGKSFGRVVKN